MQFFVDIFFQEVFKLNELIIWDSFSLSFLYCIFRLRDPSRQVRKNTLQVLTHLILNDMVKVKGQISEMAICIMDDDERIAALAKLFFHELSRKVI